MATDTLDPAPTPSPAHALERDPFFIIGLGRSGSTLLQAMLMSHPDIAIGPETYFFGRTDPRRSGHEIATAPGLATYLDFAIHDWHTRGLRFDEPSLRSAITASDRSPASIFRILLAHTSGATAASTRLGEKSPRHYRFIDTIRATLPTAQFIHICRDPRDVCLSFRDLRLGGHDSLQFYARDWAKGIRTHLRDEQRLPAETYTAVRYEDLVRDPEREVRRLCGFLAMPFHDQMLRFHEREYAGIEPQAHWKRMTMTPLTSSRIARYREKLTPREIRTIERAVGPLLGRMGYTPEPDLPDPFAWRAADLAEYTAIRTRNNLLRLIGRSPRAARPS